jgi:small subunit ribosomal protein S21
LEVKNIVIYLQPIYKKKRTQDMLIIPVKEGENIERALKKYKKKYDKTNVMKQLRGRKEFEKPSVTKRQQKLRAVYKQAIQQAEQ